MKSDSVHVFFSSSTPIVHEAPRYADTHGTQEELPKEPMRLPGQHRRPSRCPCPENALGRGSSAAARCRPTATSPPRGRGCSIAGRPCRRFTCERIRFTTSDRASKSWQSSSEAGLSRTVARTTTVSASAAHLGQRTGSGASVEAGARHWASSGACTRRFGGVTWAFNDHNSQFFFFPPTPLKGVLLGKPLSLWKGGGGALGTDDE